MWFWLAVSSGLASAVDKVFQRIAMKNRTNALANSFVYIFCIAIYSSFFSLPIELTRIDNYLVILLILQGVFWSLGTLFNFWSHSKTDVSLSMIISRARIIWMIPLGFFILGERLSVISILGMLMIFFGLATLFAKENLHKHQGIHLMTVSSIFVALGSIVNVLLIRDYLAPSQVVFTSTLSQAVIFLIILLARGNAISRIMEILKRAWYVILIATAIETYALTASAEAYKIGVASAVTAVYLGMTITTVWIGIIFLGEKSHIKKKLISSAIVTLGILIVKVFV